MRFQSMKENFNATGDLFAHHPGTCALACEVRGGGWASDVMSHAGVNHKDVLVYFKNEAIGIIDSCAPPPCAIAPEGFGLAETGVSVAVDALEYQMQTAQGLAVK